MMKSFFSVFAVLFLASASIAQAQESSEQVFRFTYFGHQSGGYSMVSCDYAKGQLTELFSLFGATSTQITCRGGVTPGGLFPLNLTAHYTLPDLGESPVVETVEVRSNTFNPLCHFNTQLVGRLVRHFDNVEILRKSDACFSNASQYFYEFEIQYPATE